MIVDHVTEWLRFKSRGVFAVKAKNIDRQVLTVEVNLRMVEYPQDPDKTIEL
jgi:hypothetical protein